MSTFSKDCSPPSLPGSASTFSPSSHGIQLLSEGNTSTVVATQSHPSFYLHGIRDTSMTQQTPGTCSVRWWFLVMENHRLGALPPISSEESKCCSWNIPLILPRINMYKPYTTQILSWYLMDWWSICTWASLSMLPRFFIWSGYRAGNEHVHQISHPADVKPSSQPACQTC